VRKGATHAAAVEPQGKLAILLGTVPLPGDGVQNGDTAIAFLKGGIDGNHAIEGFTRLVQITRQEARPSRSDP